ncbi:CLUMA_CG006438, isoform A [Clunio marinus]|uniref:CLUMA_CG006438, isoform A n=1 Tax=Clunio marinus TaxID=568069 RepID=A0A1J1I3D1_9DIPT|nr:CLUMA_CG006438, isoform A [Clunio marinus]
MLIHQWFLNSRKKGHYRGLLKLRKKCDDAGLAVESCVEYRKENESEREIKKEKQSHLMRYLRCSITLNGALTIY